MSVLAGCCLPGAQVVQGIVVLGGEVGAGGKVIVVIVGVIALVIRYGIACAGIYKDIIDNIAPTAIIHFKG